MLSVLQPLIEQDAWCLVAVNQYVANSKCYIKGSGDRVSGNRRTISTIIYSLHFRAWSQTRNWAVPDLIYSFQLLFLTCFCPFFVWLQALPGEPQFEPEAGHSRRTHPGSQFGHGLWGQPWSHLQGQRPWLAPLQQVVRAQWSEWSQQAKQPQAQRQRAQT